MKTATLVAMAALAAAAPLRGTVDPAVDPHSGRFTTGGRTCARCHAPNNPRAEGAYRMAQQMSRMVDGLNAGPLRGSPIDCVNCHRVSEHGRVVMQEDRVRFDAIQRIADHWPAASTDDPQLRRAMGRYSVALGVACNYCHSVQSWKADAKAAMKTTREMIAMMNDLPKYFDLPTTGAVITCFTCHKGAVKIGS